MKKYLPVVLIIVVAIVLLQTLRFKFTAHPDSVYIFTKLGLEPVGRIGIGTLELMVSILLLIPKTIWAGALLTLGIIGDAVCMHLITVIRIEVNDDGGTLFVTALITFILSAILLYMQRKSFTYFKSIFLVLGQSANKLVDFLIAQFCLLAKKIKCQQR